jgi:hypothetical protein
MTFGDFADNADLPTLPKYDLTFVRALPLPQRHLDMISCDKAAWDKQRNQLSA